MLLVSVKMAVTSTSSQGSLAAYILALNSSSLLEADLAAYPTIGNASEVGAPMMGAPLDHNMGFFHADPIILYLQVSTLSSVLEIVTEDQGRMGAKGLSQKFLHFFQL